MIRQQMTGRQPHGRRPALQQLSLQTPCCVKSCWVWHPAPPSRLMLPDSTAVGWGLASVVGRCSGKTKMELYFNRLKNTLIASFASDIIYTRQAPFYHEVSLSSKHYISTIFVSAFFHLFFSLLHICFYHFPTGSCFHTIKQNINWWLSHTSGDTLAK